MAGTLSRRGRQAGQPRISPAEWWWRAASALARSRAAISAGRPSALRQPRRRSHRQRQEQPGNDDRPTVVGGLGWQVDYDGRHRFRGRGRSRAGVPGRCGQRADLITPQPTFWSGTATPGRSAVAISCCRSSDGVSSGLLARRSATAAATTPGRHHLQQPQPRRYRPRSPPPLPLAAQGHRARHCRPAPPLRRQRRQRPAHRPGIGWPAMCRPAVQSWGGAGADYRPAPPQCCCPAPAGCRRRHAGLDAAIDRVQLLSRPAGPDLDSHRDADDRDVGVHHPGHP